MIRNIASQYLVTFQDIKKRCETTSGSGSCNECDSSRVQSVSSWGVISTDSLTSLISWIWIIAWLHEFAFTTVVPVTICETLAFAGLRSAGGSGQKRNACASLAMRLAFFSPQTVYCGVYSLKKEVCTGLRAPAHLGVAWAWRGRGLGVVWAWRGRGLGVAWPWRGWRGRGRGLGVAWAWRGRGVGVAWVWLGRGVGVAWAGLGVVWAWRGRGLGVAWVWRRGRGMGVWPGRGVGVALYRDSDCKRCVLVTKRILPKYKSIPSKCKNILSKCTIILSKYREHTFQVQKYTFEVQKVYLRSTKAYLKYQK